MKSLVQKIAFGLAVLSTWFFSSCLDTNDAGQTAYGDAFIKSVMLNDSVVGYNLQLYAYSWSEMKNVITYAGMDQNNLITLDTIDYKYTFAYMPETVTYSSEPPVSDDYYFRVTFDNNEQTIVTDFLYSDAILPPMVKMLEWDELDEQIKLEWYPVENAQIYSVALLTSDGRVAFETEMLETTETVKWINQFTYGWHIGLKPTENTVYQLIIRAFLFEPVASTFDIQCMSINDLNTIEWKLK